MKYVSYEDILPQIPKIINTENTVSNIEILHISISQAKKDGIEFNCRSFDRISTPDIDTLIKIILGNRIWSHILWEKDTKGNKNFQQTHLLVFDFDNKPDTPNLSVEEARDILEALNLLYIIGSTKSHQKDGKDRFRVILFFEHPINDFDTYRLIYEFFLEYIFPAADEACRDGARQWFPCTSILYSKTHSAYSLQHYPQVLNDGDVIYRSPYTIRDGKNRNETLLKETCSQLKSGKRTSDIVKETFKYSSLNSQEITSVLKNSARYTNNDEGEAKLKRQYWATAVTELLDEKYKPRLDLLTGDVVMGDFLVDTNKITEIWRECETKTIYYSMLTVNRLIDENSVKRAFHPIKEYLSADIEIKEDRIRQFFNCLTIRHRTPLLEEQAKDTEMYYLFFRRWIIAAVAKVYGATRPGPMLILQSAGQGRGKSYFFERLLVDLEKYKAVNNRLDPGNKDFQSLLAKTFVWILDEVDVFLSKHEASKIKSALTLTSVRYRPVYSLKEKDYPVVTSFCGSTNREDLFNDPSGARRFRVIPITISEFPDDIFSLQNVHEFWVQAKQAFDAGERYWYTVEENDMVDREFNSDYVPLNEVQYIVNLVDPGEDLYTAFEIIREYNIDMCNSQEKVNTLNFLLKKRDELQYKQYRVKGSLVERKYGFKVSLSRLKGFSTNNLKRLG
jgi:predicted P-loop ATPase